MNYFDIQPEDLPEMSISETRAWHELVKFVKEVHAKVFTDPPVRSDLPKEFLERYFRFRWQRQSRRTNASPNKT